ncbi:hypothetical protein [Limibacterium fermenti]|uniref:hypothetical protein n=1 Tax=Limibacterium fermenti TaxID=3229863 RepID=UPI000E9EED09|nr:hypothetical protein [Porphyromonadaceae bacterium]
MTTKTKKNHHEAQSSKGPYKVFLAEMQKMLDLLNTSDRMSYYPADIRHRMFSLKYLFTSPAKGNEFVTGVELHHIDAKTRELLHQKVIPYEKIKISHYQLLLLNCYLKTRYELAKKDHLNGLLDDDLLKRYSDVSGKGEDAFLQCFLLDHLKILTQMSNPEHKYFALDLTPSLANSVGGNRVKLTVDVFAFPPNKQILHIHDFPRPVYAMGTGTIHHSINWTNIDAHLLGDSYHGPSEQLGVYIQSHALKRLQERLDILDQYALNYTLWNNTVSIKQVYRYKGYYLLPYLLHDIKVGYLVARIIDDRFIIITFLFITHNSSPEGERLKQITGLTGRDISYWKIDRLSAFMNLDEAKYPELIALFEKAGMGSLKDLKNKQFDIDTLQTGNMEAFDHYIKLNKAYLRSFALSDALQL